MSSDDRPRVGFTCAYTPLPLLDAAGLAPYRILPESDCDEVAGELLHDNLCAHVKRVLDRARAGDLPELAGVVFMNSCDAMRRLADAWPRARPEVPSLLLDLPAEVRETSTNFFASELTRLAALLPSWGGQPVGDVDLRRSWQRYQRVAEALARLRQGAGTEAQRWHNRASTEDWDHVLPELEAAAVTPGTAIPGVPVLLFGNVMSDPEAMELLAACGARVVDDDLCTGSRLFSALPPAPGDDGDVLNALARAWLQRPPCARTVTSPPGRLGQILVERARTAGARGAIAHSLKFCDPYLARMPTVRDAFREAGLPLLVLEGDCTQRTLGQQRTRIEAFVEMLGDVA
ncbi:MAG: 2-hydroxyacyl-CoA dehydratase family protein [Pseudomonadota bacterium]